MQLHKNHRGSTTTSTSVGKEEYCRRGGDEQLDQSRGGAKGEDDGGGGQDKERTTEQEQLLVLPDSGILALPHLATTTTNDSSSILGGVVQEDKRHDANTIKNIIARADWKRSSSLILLNTNAATCSSTSSTNHGDDDYYYCREHYTADEMENLKDRDFEVRLLMTNHTIFGDKNVLLRSHFSDNHEYTSGSFKLLNDFLRASSDTYSYTAAKAALTNLLTIALDTDEGEYRTFAVTVASGLSKHGKNTHFEMESYDRYTIVQHDHCDGGDDDDDDDDVLQTNRKNFCQLMHIIFTKIPIYKFMVEDDGSNIYRLVHCSSKSTINEELPISYAIFSFLLQMCLAGYVIAQLLFNIRDGSYTLSAENENLGKILRNLPLAILTLMYSMVLSVPEIKNVPKGFKVFGNGLCMLQIMDFIVNAILPILLLIPGFFVILDQDEFIEAVLNAAALLYITGIDDQLPLLLGCNIHSIVKNYLMDKAMEEFDSIKNNNSSRGYQEESSKGYFRGAKAEGMGVQFCDYYLTNMAEQGSSPTDGLIFQPFQIRCGYNSYCGDKIDPSRLVTEECLIRKLTWQYDTDDINNKTIRPRICFLKLDLYDSIDPVTIESKRGMNPKQMFHTLDGVFIITTFQMSIDNSITGLRLCGSKNASDFLKAFTYYPLWKLSKGAKCLLKYEIQNAGVEELLTAKRLTKQNIYNSIDRTISSSTKSYQEEGHYNRMADNV